jgi:hypothetical protein
MLLRTAKSCGPDAPTLASSSRKFVRPNRARTKPYSAGDGGKRARSPGRARHKPLKPLRAGMPGVPVYSLLLVCFLPLPSAREAAGAAGIRHSPRPPWARDFMHDSGALRCEIAKLRLDSEHRHCERSEAIQTCFVVVDCFASFAMTAPQLNRRGCLKISSGICIGGSALPLPPNSGLPELGISNCRSRIYPTSSGRGLG